jgi:hypothetical protein
MTDPLELTLRRAGGPIVEVNLDGIVAPSMEAHLAPLWTTPAELADALVLIDRLEGQLIRDEYDPLSEPDNEGQAATLGRLLRTIDLVAASLAGDMR